MKCSKCGEELTECSLQNGDYYNGYCEDCMLYYHIEEMDEELFEDLSG